MSIDDQPQPRASAPKCAWATLLTSEHLLPGVVVFAHSLLVQHASAHPLVVMATAKLSARARSVLSGMLPAGRVVIREVEPIYPTSAASGLAYARFNEVWTKLRAFGLVEYERVALVDSDMLVRRNMDHLFADPYVYGGEGEWIGASWACTCNPHRIPTYPPEWTPANCGFTPQSLPSATSLSDVPQPNPSSSSAPSKLINSGLVLLTPSTSTTAEIIHSISTDPRIPQYRFPDQDFLATFFSNPPHRNIRYLPYTYNALKKLRLIHPNIWSDTAATNVHYILDKPWTLGRPGSAKNPNDVDAEIHSWWWDTFDIVKRGLGEKKGISVGDEDWKECVEKYMTMD